jgi:hypothetical protein
MLPSSSPSLNYLHLSLHLCHVPRPDPRSSSLSLRGHHLPHLPPSQIRKDLDNIIPDEISFSLVVLGKIQVTDLDPCGLQLSCTALLFCAVGVLVLIELLLSRYN